MSGANETEESIIQSSSKLLGPAYCIHMSRKQDFLVNTTDREMNQSLVSGTIGSFH